MEWHLTRAASYLVEYLVLLRRRAHITRGSPLASIVVAASYIDHIRVNCVISTREQYGTEHHPKLLSGSLRREAIKKKSRKPSKPTPTLVTRCLGDRPFTWLSAPRKSSVSVVFYLTFSSLPLSWPFLARVHECSSIMCIW